MGITSKQKEIAIEGIREFGTLKAGAKVAGMDVKTLRAERKRSAVLDRRIKDALEEGHNNLADNAIQLIIDYANGVYEKTDRNRLTAAIALANWAQPGFRGTTTVQGKVDHNVRVITGVPRPDYDKIGTTKVLSIDKPDKEAYNKKEKEKLRKINRGETVEEVIDVIATEIE